MSRPTHKPDLDALRKKAGPAKFDYRRQERAVWDIVEHAYEQMEREDKLLGECLPNGLTHFERELIRAAFSVGRRSLLDDCAEDVQIMRDLGLAA